jgi:pilus assembly protein CpaF
MGLQADAALQTSLVQRIVALVGGLGFFNHLLPSRDHDPGLSEIALNPDGSLWVLRKGAESFERLDFSPSLDEVWRAVESLLAPLGRSISESTPSVDARLPRMQGMGGARVKVIHPILASGSGYPSINIRLFEPVPVRPEKLVEWEMAPPAVIQSLLAHVARRLRVLIIGGTSSGKTTLLSALCSGIPRGARVVKIEDPEEIWLDHPHVITLEARPAMPGSTVPPYTVKDGVDDALRMSPKWLIVGEVRRGEVAMALFRAQMSDHPGLCTFHAEGPLEAVERLANIVETDLGVPGSATRANFGLAVDLVVQVGFVQGRRRIIGAWEVQRRPGGEFQFGTLYEDGQPEMRDSSIQRR